MTDELMKTLSRIQESFRIYTILLLLLLSTFGTGILFEQVGSGKYGLKKNYFTGVVDTTEVYEPGLHLVPFNDMIHFPSIFQTIEFKGEGSSGSSIFDREDNALRGSILTATTHDGLPVDIELSFQYKLYKEYIGTIFELYGEHYAETYLRIARDTLRDAASEFNATEYFYSRQEVGDLMKSYLKENLGSIITEQSSISNEVNTFQLRKLVLPQDFTEALQELEQAKIEVQKALERQKIALIEAETLIKQAQAEAEAEIIRANGTAEAYLLQMEAEAQGINVTINAQEDALYALGQSLNMTSAELLSFLWIQAISEAAEYGNLLIVGENTPILYTVDTNSTGSG